MGKLMLIEKDETIVERMKLEHYIAIISILNRIEELASEDRCENEILSDIRFELTVWKKREAME
jgi:hypothetical protein